MRNNSLELNDKLHKVFEKVQNFNISKRAKPNFYDATIFAMTSIN